MIGVQVELRYAQEASTAAGGVRDAAGPDLQMRHDDIGVVCRRRVVEAPDLLGDPPREYLVRVFVDVDRQPAEERVLPGRVARSAAS